MSEFNGLTIEELRNTKVDLIEKSRACYERAKEEGRPNPEQEQEWDKYQDDIELIEDKIKLDEQEQRQLSMEASLNESKGRKTETKTEVTRDRKYADVSRAYVSFLRNGYEGLNDVERRALQVGLSTSGGNLVLPEAVTSEIVKRIAEETPLMGLVDSIEISSAQSVSFPVETTEMTGFVWNAEGGTVSADTATAFGKVTLFPDTWVVLQKITRQLLNHHPQIESYITQKIASKFGRHFENQILNGTGSNQFLGMFTANANGIPQSARTAIASSGTAITSDLLIDLKYSLRPVYHNKPTTRWVMNQNVVRDIRKLTTGTAGDYVWKHGLSRDDDDTILSIGVVVSEFAPSPTAGSLNDACVLGDLSAYKVLKTQGMQMQRLEEKYSNTLEVGFQSYYQANGAPTYIDQFVVGKYKD